jgi:hypothetical protein
MADEALFEGKGVSVTRTMAKIGGRSYPINGIASVAVVSPHRAGGYAGSALLVLFALLFVPFPSEISTLYSLVFRTACGDQRALSGRNTNDLFGIKQGIEKAVELRG